MELPTNPYNEKQKKIINKLTSLTASSKRFITDNINPDGTTSWDSFSEEELISSLKNKKLDNVEKLSCIISLLLRTEEDFIPKNNKKDS